MSLRDILLRRHAAAAIAAPHGGTSDTCASASGPICGACPNEGAPAVSARAGCADGALAGGCGPRAAAAAASAAAHSTGGQHYAAGTATTDAQPSPPRQSAASGGASQHGGGQWARIGVSKGRSRIEQPIGCGATMGLVGGGGEGDGVVSGHAVEVGCSGIHAVPTASSSQMGEGAVPLSGRRSSFFCLPVDVMITIILYLRPFRPISLGTMPPVRRSRQPTTLAAAASAVRIGGGGGGGGGGGRGGGGGSQGVTVTSGCESPRARSVSQLGAIMLISIRFHPHLYRGRRGGGGGGGGCGGHTMGMGGRPGEDEDSALASHSQLLQLPCASLFASDSLLWPSLLRALCWRLEASSSSNAASSSSTAVFALRAARAFSVVPLLPSFHPLRSVARLWSAKASSSSCSSSSPSERGQRVARLLLRFSGGGAGDGLVGCCCDGSGGDVGEHANIADAREQWAWHLLQRSLFLLDGSDACCPLTLPSSSSSVLSPHHYPSSCLTLWPSPLAQLAGTRMALRNTAAALGGCRIKDAASSPSSAAAAAAAAAPIAMHNIINNDPPCRVGVKRGREGEEAVGAGACEGGGRGLGGDDGTSPSSNRYASHPSSLIGGHGHGGGEGAFGGMVRAVLCLGGGGRRRRGAVALAGEQQRTHCLVVTFVLPAEGLRGWVERGGGGGQRSHHHGPHHSPSSADGQRRLGAVIDLVDSDEDDGDGGWAAVMGGIAGAGPDGGNGGRGGLMAAGGDEKPTTTAIGDHLRRAILQQASFEGVPPTSSSSSSPSPSLFYAVTCCVPANGDGAIIACGEGAIGGGAAVGAAVKKGRGKTDELQPATALGLFEGLLSRLDRCAVPCSSSPQRRIHRHAQSAANAAAATRWDQLLAAILPNNVCTTTTTRSAGTPRSNAATALPSPPPATSLVCRKEEEDEDEEGEMVSFTVRELWRHVSEEEPLVDEMGGAAQQQAPPRGNSAVVVNDALANDFDLYGLSPAFVGAVGASSSGLGCASLRHHGEEGGMNSMRGQGEEGDPSAHNALSTPPRLVFEQVFPPEKTTRRRCLSGGK